MLLSSYDLLGGATDGINSEGLAAALMSTADVLHAGSNPATFINGVGINEIQLVRFVLENAATAAEARELLARVPQYTMWVPCHFIIGDRSGDAFVYSRDVSPTKPAIRQGDPSSPLCSTNHIPGHVVGDGPWVEESKARLEKLQATSDGLRAHPVAMSDIQATIRSVEAKAPSGEGQYASTSLARTLWQGVYDLDERSLLVDFYLGEDAAGTPRRSDPVPLRLAAD
jgi:hypothetical protein